MGFGSVLLHACHVPIKVAALLFFWVLLHSSGRSVFLKVVIMFDVLWMSTFSGLNFSWFRSQENTISRLLFLRSDREGSAEAVRKPHARERKKPNFDDTDDGKPFQASHKAEVGKSALCWVGPSLLCLNREYFRSRKFLRRNCFLKCRWNGGVWNGGDKKETFRCLGQH